MRIFCIFPQFNKSYYNDSLNSIFDFWKETFFFPHETHILVSSSPFRAQAFFSLKGYI